MHVRKKTSNTSIHCVHRLVLAELQSLVPGKPWTGHQSTTGQHGGPQDNKTVRPVNPTPIFWESGRKSE